MVSNLSATRRVYMFIDGLVEPFHGLVKSTRTTTLQEAIERARDLQHDFPRVKAPLQQNFSSQSKEKDMKVPPSKDNQDKGSLSDDFWRDLRRGKLFFMVPNLSIARRVYMFIDGIA